MKPWQQIPSIEDTKQNPNALKARIERVTGRKVILRHFDQFSQDFAAEAKTPPELFPYAILTHLYPRCVAAVLDGSEDVRGKSEPLCMLVRTFDGCKHALSALYDFHPVEDSPWNDGLWDHVRMWTWTKCEICEGAELRRVGGVQ
jgi:hypothetical protein